MRKVVTLCSILLILLSATVIVGCQQQPAPTLTPTPTEEAASTPTSTEIKISGFAFVSATVTVAEGTTVTWTNNDSVPHTVTTQIVLFDSGNLSRGDTFGYTFAQSGTFEYYCTIHPYMVGKVIVE